MKRLALTRKSYQGEDLLSFLRLNNDLSGKIFLSLYKTNRLRANSMWYITLMTNENEVDVTERCSGRQIY